MKISILAKIALGALCAVLLVGCAPQVTSISASDERLGTLVGERGQAEIKAAGTAGFLVFGPYIPLAAGTYRLTVKGNLEGSSLPLAVVDVASGRGELVWATRPIYDNASADVITTIAFVIDSAVVDAEFRILLAEETVGTFKGFELKKIE